MKMLNAQTIREAITTVLSDVSKDDGKIGWVNPFDGEKGSILLETRMFNETPLNPNKCFDCLTKVLNLIITKGETLTLQEESDLFFGVTKLFQSSNDRLRRMVYLAIKTFNINEGEAFIVTSSLTKDMNSGSDVHRANAIRVLSKIVDASMATQIERYLKTAIVDKSPFVASSALVCGMSLLKSCPDVVKRWVNEVTETVRSKNTSVQFHALGLLYELKKSDRLALHKVVGTLTASPLKSSFAECLLIRYATRILRAEKDPQLEKSIVDYLCSRLHHRCEMTVLESARALCDLACDDPRGGMEVCGVDLTPTLTALQIMLSNQRPAVRFAAVRTLNTLSRSRPQAVARCNNEIEALLSDGNRSIATLALTSLLKTGHESGVERLIKQISLLMADIADSFKVEVIKAVRQLASIYPSKHRMMMSFLATQLREEGTYEVKRDLVEALAGVMTEIPQAQETGLFHLCEFIEDCEYASLCIRILGLLGELAPTTNHPSKFVRFIYNRLILENAAVRAAAVDGLTRVGLHCHQLRSDIAILLESCLVDNDDEIRDRACLYFKALNSKENDSDSESTSAGSIVSLDELLTPDVPLSLDALVDYTKQWIESSGSVGPLDLSILPSEYEYQSLLKEAQATSPTVPSSNAPIGTSPLDTDVSVLPDIATELDRVCSSLCPDEIFGQIDHSCKPLPLTEKEAEYSVLCVKHVLTSVHIILEFQVTNTMPDQKLQNVEISPTNFDSSQWSIIGTSRIDELSFDSPRSCFSILKKIDWDIGSDSFVTGTFAVSLNYIVKEEGDEIGYDDSYALEPVRISIGDYLIPRGLRQGQFKSQWNLLSDYGEAMGKFSLTYRTIDSAISGIIDLMNLSPCENSESVSSTATSHDLLLSGILVGGITILVRCMVVMSPKHGCLLKVLGRSKNKKFAELLLTVFD